MASDGTSKVSVRSLWKIFNHNAQGSEVPSELAGKNKAQMLEEDGLVLGLKDVNFDVQQGETFVVMGLSGSGKSTLVRTLTRLIEPSYGQIFVDGEDILEYSDKELVDFRRKKTAMVFQHFGLMPHRTVLENAAWALEVQNVPKAKRLAKARETLSMVGLSGWEDYNTGQLSGGMQQRVGLARAIAADTDILLMDEPFSGLDPLIRRDMQFELINLQEQLHKTLIFITHDLNEALRIGTRIMIMRDAEVIQLGTGEEILANPADDYVADFVRDIRRTTVMTISSMMEKPSITLRDTMTPKEAMETVGLEGEVAGFVVDRRKRYVGTVSFASLAEASQRDDRNIRDAVCDDVVPIAADMSVYGALPLVRHATGAIPIIDDDGQLVGQIVPTAVRQIMEEEIAEEAQAEADAEADAAAKADARAAEAEAELAEAGSESAETLAEEKSSDRSDDQDATEAAEATEEVRTK